MRYLDLLENAADAFVVSDLDGRILDVNQQACASTGYTRDELLAMFVWDIEASHRKAEMMAAWPQLEPGRHLTCEGTHRRKDGSLFPVEIRLTPLDWEGRRCILTLARDATDRRKAELALRESQSQLQQIYDLSPVMMHSIDEQGRIVKVNRKWLEVTGYTREEVIGRKADFLMTPESARRAFAEVIPKFWREGSARDVPYQYVKKDGTIIDVLLDCQAVTDSSGRRVSVSVVRDVTERKRALEALRDSEARYRAIVEDQTELICRFMPDGTLTFVNDAYCRYFSRRRENLIGHKFMPLIPQEEHELFARHLASFSPDRSVAVIEHRVILGDGSIRWQQWTDRAMFDEAGAIIEFQSVGRDITARKEAEDALRRAHEQLEERVRERTAELSRANAVLADEILQRERAQELLRTSEEKYRNLIEHLQDVVWEVDTSFVFTYVSSNAREVLGYRPEEIVGTPAFKYVSAEDMMMKLAELFAKSLNSLEPFRLVEIAMTHKDGRQVMLESSGAPIVGSDGQISGFRGVSRDVTERKQMQEALRQSEERYRHMFESMSNAVAVYRATDDGDDFIFVDLNSAAERLEKVARAKVIGKPVTDVFPGIKPFGLFDVLQRVWRTGTPEHHAPRIYEDPRIKGWRENFVYRLASGEVVAIYEDVTKNEQTREEKEATIQLLSLINLAGSSHELVSTLAQFLRSWSGCDAVGIRLREGDDFPYFETTGLPGEFVQLESRLCELDEEGQPRRDADGNLVLQCLCGRVVRGLTDPTKPFYTSHGSFWSNNLSRLLGKVSGNEWGTHLRGRCPAAGYESLALVPLRCGQETIGLVQFNGAREGCFSPDRISLLERLAHSAAIAIEQRRAKEALVVHQQQLQSLASELALAEERERRRIATTLHDNIGQNLALARMKLGELRKQAAGGPLAPQVEKVLELTEQIIKQTRLLTGQLSPPILYELGFEAAVEWLAEQFQKEHGIACSMEDDRQPKPLDDNVRVVLFQAVRELLMNVAKHARASRAEVSIRRIDQQLHVTVEDDGIGFDASHAAARREATSGFGLFSIRERLGHLGGHVTIEPLPQRGTRVCLIAPLRETQE